ncbi:ABC transporter permease [Marivivens sp. LCG002]|uniref:ABC transporter permease n=1 Tax=Marivivens sp. LCG002 TaxID=3051171 RepID=UPI002552E914|nr:ABC transporter permease [Marivivens sp. LCG002]WIV51753.1 ABC transporter permease [Marivivens sp. LCG002]
MSNAENQSRSSRGAVFIASLLAMFFLWIALSWGMGRPNVLPMPWEVWRVVLKEAASGRLFDHTLVTLFRVTAAFGLSMALGLVIGVSLGLLPRLNRFAEPWVVLAQNMPALVVIVLCYLWFGLNDLAAILAVSFNKTALVVVTLREGTRALDRHVSEMASVFGMSASARVRHVILPQLAPYIAASARNGLAIIWKLVLVVEFLGRGDGVGFQIHLNFQMFDVTAVLAYSLTFIALMLCIEYLVIQPLEARARRWRR